MAGATAGRRPGRPSMRGARQGNDRADEDDRLDADRADHPFHDVDRRFSSDRNPDSRGSPRRSPRPDPRTGPPATDEGVRVEREGRHGRRSRVRAVRVDRPAPDGSLRERGALIPPGQAARSRAPGAVTRVRSAGSPPVRAPGRQDGPGAGPRAGPRTRTACLAARPCGSNGAGPRPRRGALWIGCIRRLSTPENNPVLQPGPCGKEGASLTSLLGWGVAPDAASKARGRA